jgi:hypothetical protein
MIEKVKPGMIDKATSAASMSILEQVPKIIQNRHMSVTGVPNQNRLDKPWKPLLKVTTTNGMDPTT